MAQRTSSDLGRLGRSLDNTGQSAEDLLESTQDSAQGEDNYPSFLPRYRGNSNLSARWAQKQPSSNFKGVFAEARYQEEKRLLSWFQDPTRVVPWRVKDRMKTVSVGLVVCLNIGVDPPDAVKIPPFAKMQCWIDPTEQTPAKALETIGKNLQAQYEVWQSKARFKQCLDPTVEDVKKLCVSMRKSSKDERILFHYNGHGVPKPTTNGEIWVFNKQYTQYIPLSIYELQSWMGSPSMYVFDCSNAGLIIKAYLDFADQRDRENERKMSTVSAYTTDSESIVNPRDCIILAACGIGENIPLNHLMPADLFTACLTTPIQVAIRWFAQKSQLIKISIELAEKLPGRLIDRRTPLGELNWIFTAVTDTIAWNILSPDMFQKLFRQDMLVASLMRNYLLAERVMRSYQCHPVCYPKIPSTASHPLWESWDLALEGYFAQMPGYDADPSYSFQPSNFFAEQLTAFEMWLELASDRKGIASQLPIVLQVLLSQSHRLRALNLLARFLDLGPWAVNMALSVGIFPYVLKLLQSPAADLRETLIFIWAKLLSADQSCQIDLIKDNCHVYFINILTAGKIPNEQKASAAFVLSLIMYKCPLGQICLSLLADQDDSIRQWACLCLANLWVDHDEAKVAAIKENAHEKLLQLLHDPSQEVRAAAIYALGAFIGKVDPKQEQRVSVEHSIGLSLLFATTDLSCLVRREQIVALSRLVESYATTFRECAFIAIVSDIKKKAEESNEPVEFAPELSLLVEQYSRQRGSTCNVVWEAILKHLWDPVASVSQLAVILVQEVLSNLNVKLPMDKCSFYSLLSSRLSRRQLPRMSIRATSPGRQGIGSPTTTLRKASNAGFSTPRGYDQDTSDERMRRVMSAEVQSQEQERARSGSEYIVDEDFFIQPNGFYEWCCKRYNISKQALDVDPHSEVSYERRWRLSRNERLAEDIALLASKTVSSKFDKQIALLDNNSELIYAMTFHPYENHLIVADEKSTISIWDIEQGSKINSFHNLCSPKNRITSFKIYSDNDTSLLAVSSDDSIIRIWKKYDISGEQQLVSGWRAFDTASSKQNGSGLVMDWSMDSDIMVTSGDVSFIKLWSAQKQLALQEIPLNTEASVTCLAASCNILSAGFSDGSVRLYDTRIAQSSSVVQTFTEHKSWVVNTFIQNTGPTIVSGSLAGDIRFWDIRSASSVKNIQAHSNSMISFTAHENLPLLASASKNQQIKIFNPKSETVNILQYHNGFLGQRIGVVSSLAFHPHQLLLAAGSADSIISIYAGTNPLGDK